MSTRDAAGAANVAALRDHLAGRDEPCPSCGYNLRGLASQRCPECDEPLVLRISIAEPKLGAWIGVLSGLFACFGAALICLLFVAYIVVVVGNGVRGKELFPIVIYPGIIVALTGGVSLWLISRRGRRWFRARPKGVRVAGAITAWALVFVAFAGFLAMVRR